MIIAILGLTCDALTLVIRIILLKGADYYFLGVFRSGLDEVKGWNISSRDRVLAINLG